MEAVREGTNERRWNVALEPDACRVKYEMIGRKGRLLMRGIGCEKGWKWEIDVPGPGSKLVDLR